MRLEPETSDKEADPERNPQTAANRCSLGTILERQQRAESAGHSLGRSPLRPISGALQFARFGSKAAVESKHSTTLVSKGMESTEF